MRKERSIGISWSAALRGSALLRTSWERSCVLGLLRRKREASEREDARRQELRPRRALSFRRRLMRARERSLVTRAFTRLCDLFLRTRVREVGAWWIFSALGVALLGALTRQGFASVQGWFLLGLTLAILPLLFVGDTVHAVAERSAWVRMLFGEPPPVFLPPRRGSLVGFFASSLAASALMLLFTPMGFVGGAGILCALFFCAALPERALMALLFALPLLQLFPRPTVLLCILILCVQFSYAFKVLCCRREFSPDRMDAAVLLFCILLLGGGLFGSGSFLDGAAAAVLVSLWFPVRGLIDSPHWRERAYLSMQASALPIALFGIWQYFFGDLPLLWVDVERFSDIGTRVTSLFGNPNLFAIYLLLLFPSALCGICHALDARKKLFFLSCAVAEFAAVVLTFSRGAWLGILLEILLFLLLESRRTRAALLLLPLPVLSVVPWLPSGVLKRLSSITSMAESSIRYRLYTWRGVGRMIAEHPHGIGVGESAFAAVYPRYAVSGTETVMHAHNVFLQVMSEVGIVGLLLFCTILAVALLRALRIGVDRAAPVALLGTLVMGCFDHLWYERSHLALFFVMAALCCIKQHDLLLACDAKIEERNCFYGF